MKSLWALVVSKCVQTKDQYSSSINLNSFFGWPTVGSQIVGPKIPAKPLSAVVERLLSTLRWQNPFRFLNQAFPRFTGECLTSVFSSE